ncbi:MAG: phenylacetate--CoA ligase [Alphaproteobacteria bacterium]|nr:phenylacetate--CoA ligase [Alphaproteobacteria bacterium]
MTSTLGDVAASLARSPDAIAEAQSAALRAMLALCARGHAYYRREWTGAGLDIASIRGLDDLARLPLTTKDALMAEPEAFRLRLPDLPLEERAIAEVIHTTGSTAMPTPVYNTTHDVLAYMFQARCMAAIAGLGEHDVIANLFPLTPAPMGAFQRSAQNAFAIGAAIVSALPGAPFGAFAIQRSLDEAVRLVALHRATVVWGVTSFVRRVLLRALELKADVTAVRLCAVAGEASSPALREELRRLMRELGCAGQRVFDRYGSTELGALAQCREDGPWHNPAPDLLHLAAVDAETGQPLPEGERGWLALTHLNRRGTVLLRFLQGDVVAVERGRCPDCGRAGERVVGPVVRAKDLVKVKGMLINPAVLLEELARLPDLAEFQVVVRRDNALAPDELVVRVAGRGGDELAMTARVVAATRRAVGVSPRVECVAAGEIYDPARQPKAVRFVDRRPAP